jgi:hypothetical protein
MPELLRACHSNATVAACLVPLLIFKLTALKANKLTGRTPPVDTAAGPSIQISSSLGLVSRCTAALLGLNCQACSKLRAGSGSEESLALSMEVPVAMLEVLQQVLDGEERIVRSVAALWTELLSELRAAPGAGEHLGPAALPHACNGLYPEASLDPDSDVPWWMDFGSEVWSTDPRPSAMPCGGDHRGPKLGSYFAGTLLSGLSSVHMCALSLHALLLCLSPPPPAHQNGSACVWAR